jgi:2-keto-4-pentenoate hydratase/2-oxohepta-3-ene-1,7-dioic acid hydratase in catechol pathway
MILCVGQNYAKHVAELGSPPASEPIWFLKPESAVIYEGQSIRIPAGIGAVHHEAELAIRIGPGGAPDAMTIAIDVTARDLQNDAKKAGRPWTKAKGFDTFLPLGTWVPLAGDLQNLRLQLSVNGEIRQDGSTAEMTWSVAELLSAAASWTTLAEGDILLTGTPDGVGPVLAGQTISASIVGHVDLRVGVTSA